MLRMIHPFIPSFFHDSVKSVIPFVKVSHPVAGIFLEDAKKGVMFAQDKNSGLQFLAYHIIRVS